MPAHLPGGICQIIATPDADDDIELAFYGANGVELATINNAGVGVFEGADIDRPGGVLFAIARDIGNSSGSCSISATKQ